jgi:peptidylprolyl isomerase
VIKGLDDAVTGMRVGERRTVHVPAAQGYGERNDELILEIPKAKYPRDKAMAVGVELFMGDDAGNMFPVVVAEMKERTIVLDANHPLAGQDLIFDIELLSIGAI